MDNVKYSNITCAYAHDVNLIHVPNCCTVLIVFLHRYFLGDGHCYGTPLGSGQSNGAAMVRQCVMGAPFRDT